MKRWLLLLLLTVLTCLTACGKPGETASSPAENTITFYYRAQLKELSRDAAALDTEAYACSAGEPDYLQLLADYFAGPGSEDLTAAFPKGTKAVNAVLDGTLLRVRLEGDYEDLTGIERTLADACLTLTLTQLPGVERVLPLAEGESPEGAAGYTAQDFVLLDTGSSVNELSVKLFFADGEDRYLLTELRQIVPAEPAAVAEYIITQLIAGPAEEEHYPVMPENTQLLSLQLEGGLCTVDLSAAFLENRPRTEAGEWMTVYAIVNALTQMDEINQVRILCQGETIEYYRYMKLDQPLTGFDAIIGPVRYGLSEFDATLYLGAWSPDYLATVPVRIRQTTAYTKQELMLQTLLSYVPPVGCRNLIPEETRVLNVEVSDGVCTVDLSREFMGDLTNLAEQRLRVNALTAALCSLPDGDIRSVFITIQGEAVSMGWYDLSQPLTVSQDWFYP